jgi:hypothetical protein
MSAPAARQLARASSSAGAAAPRGAEADDCYTSELLSFSLERLNKARGRRWRLRARRQRWRAN